MATAEERRRELKAAFSEASTCTRCPELVRERRTVVFGSGHADADLMLVGEAPGRLEDEQGLPAVGAAGRLLSELLEGIGLERSEVFITTAVKCRTPGGRDPHPQEVASCRPYLDRQVELVRPVVVCTLGGFATKLLREDPASVRAVHGRAEVRTIGPRAVRLLPLFHPAAALYAPALLQTLREDVARIPALLAMGPPEQPGPPAPPPPPEPAPEPASRPEPARRAEDEEQLGLF